MTSKVFNSIFLKVQGFRFFFNQIMSFRLDEEQSTQLPSQGRKSARTGCCSSKHYTKLVQFHFNYKPLDIYANHDNSWESAPRWSVLHSF